MSSAEPASEHATEALAEANRLMVVCNSCRYCEGLCAVFPAMERRRVFSDGDLNYLANLCHGCGACFDACQFSPPHEFNVNVPRALGTARNDSYQSYAWPRALSGLYARNGLAIAIIAALSVAAFILGCVTLNDPGVVWGRHAGAGAFYRVMPHTAMIAVFGAVFLYAVVAMLMSARNFWRDTGGGYISLKAVGEALIDAGRLRYLDGGKAGCETEGETGPDKRKLFHHLTFYGFGLCLLSTCVATLYHYGFGLEAPYAWYDLPVVLGTLGGIGIVAGPAGLLAAKLARPRDLADEPRFGMDAAFLLMLALTGATGLGLLALRETSLMGLLLAVHLGFVFALFFTMPYGKFVHGLYRFLALVRHAREGADERR